MLISRDDLGKAWPLIPSDGSLFCATGDQVIFTSIDDGETYAINRTARQNMGTIWKDGNTIRAKDADGYEKDPSVLIEVGLGLCHDGKGKTLKEVQAELVAAGKR